MLLDTYSCKKIGRKKVVNMNTLLYIMTAAFLIYSYFKDKKKTKIALRKAWKAFENILPEFLVVIMLV